MEKPPLRVTQTSRHRSTLCTVFFDQHKMIAPASIMSVSPYGCQFNTIMKILYSLVIFLLNYGCIINAANILALFNIPSPSLHIWNSPLVIALAEKGHNVTVLSTKPQSKPVANLTDIVFEGMYEFVGKMEDFVPEEMSDMSPFTSIPMFMKGTGDFCEFCFQSEAFKTLNNYPDNFKFDLIIFEPSSGECLLGLAKKFGSPPLIAVSSFSHVQWINYMVQNPDHPAYMPHLFLSYTDHMTFCQRVHNFLLYLYTEYAYEFTFLPTVDDVAKRHLGPSASIPSEELRRVSMLMVNTHPAFDHPRPLLPSVINVAGIHIKEPKALPEDLKVFLDEAKEGVIFFSLGSNVRSSQLKKEKIQAILEAFSELPEKVLWKWEADTLPGQPKNVKIGKWLPQNDILAHPNVRLFITHSGLLSTQETIYRGVPVVGIPFLGDQQINIHKSVNHGIGVHLPYKDINKNSLLRAIRTVLDDPSYTKNIRELSAKMRDQPETPLQRAVYWCEYVMRHNGARHLRSAAMDLNRFQYLLLDEISVIIIGIITVFVFIVYLFKFIFCRKRTQKKIKKN